MKHRIITLLNAAAFASLAMSAHAGIILSDSFTYPDGDVTMAPGSPWVVHSGTTTAALVQSGQLRVTGGSAQDVNALLAGGPYLSNSPAVLYASFKLRCTSQPGVLGTYIAHFKDTNTGAATGFGGRVWVSATNSYAGTNLTSGQFRVGVGNGTSATAASGQIDQTLELNSNYVIVTRFVPNTGIATIWLNPSSESDPSVTANDIGTAARPNPIDVVAYAFRQNTGEGTDFMDDLRVGTSFADVAGANNPPSITGLPNQIIAASSSTPVLAFTVGDAETAAGGLTVSGSSSNPTLVPNANIVFAGSDSNRTVTVTPAGSAQGSAQITLTVTDGDGASATTSFQVFVGIPTISAISNASTPSNTVAGPISFTVADTETPPGDLNVTATSSNTDLLPNAGIALGGNGANRTITLFPATDRIGLTTITIVVSDGTSTASRSFTLTVNPLLGIQAMDDFSYADGSLVFNSGTWIHHSGSTVGEMPVVGGKVLLSEDQDEDVNLELNSRPLEATNGVILYARLTVTCTTNLPSTSGNYFAHYKDDTIGFRGRLFTTRVGAASGKFRLAFANNATSVSSNSVYPLDLSTNTTYTVVTRYDIGTGQSTLWIDPTSESSPSLSNSDGAASITVQAFAFRQAAGMGALTVDDLKIGTSFSDVLAVAPHLTISASGNDVSISWSGGGTLLYSDDITAPRATWTEVAGATSPYVTQPSASQRFYIVRQP